MKKRIGILAIAIAASCAVGLAGCSKGGTNVANLKSNWFSYTAGGVIQPTFVEGDDDFKSAEEIVYDVTFTPQANNLGYKINYEKGKYTTTFKAVKLDAATIEDITDADYNRTEYTEKLEAAGEKGITAYYYHTVYTTKVTYTYNNKEESFDDSTETTCYFLSVGEKLRPLYSYRAIVNASPSNKEAYKQLDLEYKCYYKFNGSAVKSYTTDHLKDNKETVKTVSLGGAANTLFDIASFNIAVRAANLNAGTGLSQTISAYSVPDGIGNFTLQGNGSKLVLDNDEEKNNTALADLKDKLDEKGLFVKESTTTNDEGEEEVVENQLSTIAVNVVYNGDLTGVSQTYWFLAVDNPYNNTGRATMLKVSSPLPFGLGTLNFTLLSIESTFWNE